VVPGRRSTLHALHDRRLDMQPANDGRFVPRPVPAPVAAE
jgi:putative ATP-binding cassette transporter